MPSFTLDSEQYKVVSAEIDKFAEYHAKVQSTLEQNKETFAQLEQDQSKLIRDIHTAELNIEQHTSQLSHIHRKLTEGASDNEGNTQAIIQLQSELAPLLERDKETDLAVEITADKLHDSIVTQHKLQNELASAKQQIEHLREVKIPALHNQKQALEQIVPTLESAFEAETLSATNARRDYERL